MVHKKQLEARKAKAKQIVRARQLEARTQEARTQARIQQQQEQARRQNIDEEFDILSYPPLISVWDRYKKYTGSYPEGEKYYTTDELIETFSKSIAFWTLESSSDTLIEPTQTTFYAAYLRLKMIDDLENFDSDFQERVLKRVNELLQQS